METFESGKEEGTIYFSVKGRGSWSSPTHELIKKDKLKISDKIKTDDCRACESVNLPTPDSAIAAVFSINWIYLYLPYG